MSTSYRQWYTDEVQAYQKKLESYSAEQLLAAAQEHGVDTSFEVIRKFSEGTSCEALLSEAANLADTYGMPRSSVRVRMHSTSPDRTYMVLYLYAPVTAQTIEERDPDMYFRTIRDRIVLELSRTWAEREAKEQEFARLKKELGK